MKKRIVLSVILTALIVLFAYPFYFKIKGVELEFKAKGDGKIAFKVYYSRKKRNVFDESLSFNSVRDVASEQNIKLTVLHRFVKSIRLDFGDKKFGLELSDIKINGKKVDLNKIFFYDIDKHEIKDGVLQISSDKKDPFIVFYENSFYGLRFNYKVFVILTALTFLLMYNVVRYLSFIKIKNNASRLDLVFVSLFFVLLFVPMLKINKEDISKRENRTLSKYPDIVIDSEINNNFGKGFESFFNDRFLGRETLISFAKAAEIKLKNNKVEKKLETTFAGQPRQYVVSSGKDGWFFDNLRDFGMILRDDMSFEKMLKNIREYQDFAKENNIKIYFSIIPRKIDFSKDYSYRKLGNLKDITDDAVVFLKENGVDVVYPKEEMKEANKKDMVYFKTDHHWTQWGAYIQYQALMKKIKKDFPDIEVVTEDDFDTFYNKRVSYKWNNKFYQGGTANSLGFTINNAPLNTDYKFYKYKKPEELKVAKINTTNKAFPYESFSNKNCGGGGSFLL